MPLVAMAYLAFAAGLLLGSGGEVFAAGLAVVIAILISLTARSSAALSLGMLLAAGATLARLTTLRDSRCSDRIRRDGIATVVLQEPIRNGWGARGDAISPGCRIPVRLRTPRGVAAPAGATVLVAGEGGSSHGRMELDVTRLTLREPPGLLARWRTRAGQTIDSLYGPHAPLARALLIADERDIDPEVRRAFADSGIIHMLSVSGLHVAVLAEALVMVALFLRIPLRHAEAGATVSITIFVIFVGAPSPAVRAAAMYAALVLSRRLQRPTSPWALLALGAAVPLVDPRVAGEVGYHLSVVGMAALIAAGRLVRRFSVKRLPPWGQRMSGEAIATVVASLATAPIVAWHFGRISLVSPLTNLAAAPLFGLAQPALFLSLLLAPLRPVAGFVAQGTGLLLGAIERTGAAGAAIPFSSLDVMPEKATAILTAVAVAGFLTACTAHFWVRPILVAVGGVGLGIWWPLVRPGGSAFEIHMMDVGQGDAIALRTPRGRWILFDAGGTWSKGNSGERTVAPYLRRRGGEVALLVLSHAHADHIGGAASVIERLPVRRIWDGAYVQASTAYAELLQAGRSSHVPWHRVHPGDRLDVDGVILSVLAPDSLTVARAEDANAASVVVMAKYQGVRVLLTGDMEFAQEAALVKSLGPELRTDILKVGHHGSATSSSAAFLDAVSPRLALVSVGAGNSYGHPDREVLDRFRKHGTRVLRTDDEGTIVIRVGGGWIRLLTDDGRWRVRELHPGAGESTLATPLPSGPLSGAR